MKDCRCQGELSFLLPACGEKVPEADEREPANILWTMQQAAPHPDSLPIDGADGEKRNFAVLSL